MAIEAFREIDAKAADGQGNVHERYAGREWHNYTWRLRGCSVAAPENPTGARVSMAVGRVAQDFLRPLANGVTDRTSLTGSVRLALAGVRETYRYQFSAS